VVRLHQSHLAVMLVLLLLLLLLGSSFSTS